MAKATIEVEGMKVEIDASSEDISDIIDDIREREQRRKERLEFREKNSLKFRTRNALAHKSSYLSSGLALNLRILLKSEFFNEGKVIREILLALKERGVVYPTTTLHPMLKRMVDRKELTRTKNNADVWEYSKTNKSEGITK